MIQTDEVVYGVTILPENFRFWPISADLRGAPKSSAIRGTTDVLVELPP